MEFVAFVLCMLIIAQINAAPTPDSGSSIPHQDNEFELPAAARGGFDMVLDVTIDGKYHETVQDKLLKVVLLPNEEGQSDVVTKFCANKGEGTHICILPHDEALLNKSGEPHTTAIKVQITAVLKEDYLDLVVLLEDSMVANGMIPVSDFEKRKHFSVGGITGSIQKLHFDFTHNR